MTIQISDDTVIEKTDYLKIDGEWYHTEIKDIENGYNNKLYIYQFNKKIKKPY